MKKTYNDGDTHLIANVDEMSGDTIVRTYQDVEPHLEACAAERREQREHTAFGKRGDLRKTMSVPFNVINSICLEHGLDFFNPEHAKMILKILKGSDYKKFRTSEAKRI